MFLKELGAFVLFYIQVSSATIYLGLALMGAKPGVKKVVTIGFIHGLTQFIVRYLYSVLNIPLGSHVVFTLLSFIVASRYVARVNWGVSIAATLIGCIVNILSEALLLPIFLNFVNISVEEYLSNLWLHIFGGYLTDSLVFILAFVVSITGFSFIKSNTKENPEIGGSKQNQL